MRKKYIISFIISALIFVSVIAVNNKVAGSFVPRPGPVVTALQYNNEENRDAATVVLDAAVLVSLCKDVSAVANSGIDENSLSSLKEIKNLYEALGNKKRVRWLKSLLKNLKQKVSKQPSLTDFAQVNEYKKEWEGILKVIKEEGIEAAKEKVKEDPFLTAKLGQFLMISKDLEGAEYLFRDAIVMIKQDNVDVDYQKYESALSVIISGYISLGKNSSAINLYDNTLKYSKNLYLSIVKQFIAKGSYNSALNILAKQDSEKNIQRGFIAVASKLIKDGKKDLTEENSALIKGIVSKYDYNSIKPIDDIYKKKFSVKNKILTTLKGKKK